MTDEKLEGMIGNILRAGVITAALVVTVSGIFYLIQHHAAPVRYSTFEPGRPNLRTLKGILQDSVQLHPDALIQLGLILLIATPIARVALAAVGFYLERDHLFVGVSLTVFAILIFSLVHST